MDKDLFELALTREELTKILLERYLSEKKEESTKVSDDLTKKPTVEKINYAAKVEILENKMITIEREDGLKIKLKSLSSSIDKRPVLDKRIVPDKPYVAPAARVAPVAATGGAGTNVPSSSVAISAPKKKKQKKLPDSKPSNVPKPRKAARTAGVVAPAAPVVAHAAPVAHVAPVAPVAASMNETLCDPTNPDTHIYVDGEIIISGASTNILAKLIEGTE